MKVTRKHKLTQEAAREKIDLFLQRLLQQYDQNISQSQSEWRQDTLDFSFKTRRINLKGNVVVGQSEVTLDMPLPLPAKLLYEGRIRTRVEQELEALFPD